jgi:hypothetical protein
MCINQIFILYNLLDVIMGLQTVTQPSIRNVPAQSWEQPVIGPKKIISRTCDDEVMDAKSLH